MRPSRFSPAAGCPALPVSFHGRISVSVLLLLGASLFLGVLLLRRPARAADAVPEAPRLSLQVCGKAFLLEVSPDGKYLAALDSTAVTLWDLRTRAIVQRIPCDSNLRYGATRIHFSSDSRRLFISGLTQPFIWDLGEKRLVTISPPGELAWLTADGQHYWSATHDNTLEWSKAVTFTQHDPATGKAGHTTTCCIGNLLKFSPDCSLLINNVFPDEGKAAMSGEPVNEIWDLNAGKMIAHLDSSQCHVEFPLMVFSDDSRFCATKCYGNQADANGIGIFNARTGAITQMLTDLQIAQVETLAFNKAGTKIANAGVVGKERVHQITVWDIATGKLLHQFTGPAGDVNALTFSPDGAHLWISSGGALQCWDLQTEKVSVTLSTPISPSKVYSTITPDARHFVVASPDGFALWDLTQGRLAAQYHAPEPLTPWRQSDFIRVSPDGRRVLAALNTPGNLMSWDAVSGATSVYKPDTKNYAQFACRGTDGKRAVTHSFVWDQDGTHVAVEVWDMQDWRKISSTPMQWPDTSSNDGKKMAKILHVKGDSRYLCIMYDLPGQRQTAKCELTDALPKVAAENELQLELSFSQDDTMVNIDCKTSKQHLLVQVDSQTGKIVHSYPLPVEAGLPRNYDVLAGNYLLTCRTHLLSVYDLKQQQQKDIPLGYTPYSCDLSSGVVLTSDHFSGTLDIWKLADLLTTPAPRPRATLQLFSKGLWLITTPDGYFDCSPELTKVMRWTRQGKEYPYEQFAPQYHQPDMVRKAIGGSVK